MKLFNKLALSIVSFSLIASESQFNFSIDEHYSPYTGSDALLSTHESLELLDRWISDETEEPKKGLKPSINRWAYLCFFWTPLNYLTTTVQHEVFGHGYRIRTMDVASVTSYHFDAPPPFGHGGGSTAFKMSNQIYLGELQAIAVAGLEAESILSRNLKSRFIKQKKINPKLGSLYTVSRYSSLIYSFVPFFEEKSIEDHLVGSHDIQNYVNLLGYLYPESVVSSEDPNTKKLVYSADKMRKSTSTQLLFNFLDPMTFYEIGAYWYYIFTGKMMNIPMIKLKEDLLYLPNVSVQIAPYGLEYYLENFLLHKDSLTYFYLKGGALHGNKYYGFGAQSDDLFVLNKYSIGMKVDGWYQPNFLAPWQLQQAIDGEIPVGMRKKLEERVLGGSINAVAKYNLANSSNYFFSEFGVKSKGYLPGYPLDAAPIWRLGFSAQF
jgi:hypothetical protein